MVLRDDNRENDIEIAYLIKPLWGGNNVFEKGLSANCYNKVEITKILDSYTIKDCDDLKN